MPNQKDYFHNLITINELLKKNDEELGELPLKGKSNPVNVVKMLLKEIKKIKEEAL